MPELGMIRPWEMAGFTEPEIKALDAGLKQLEAEARKAERMARG
jgi:hypothetical protein